MLFLVDQDLGHSLVGYLVPDSVVEPGRFAVRVGDQEVYRGETDIDHPDLVAIGRHQTGRCGFHLTDAHVPGLAELVELDIVDLVSDLTIYRRRPPDSTAQRRIFRLETHLLPLAGLDRSLERMFQLWFPHIDRVGAETANQIFQMKSESNYISGRVSLPTVHHLVEKYEYGTVLVLHDPFEELAERLLFMRLVAQHPNRVLGERDEVFFAETLEFAREVDLETEKGLRRAFRMLDATVASRLANPIVRQLATIHHGEGLTGSAVGKAVSALAGFDVIGIRRRPDLFSEALTDLLRLPAGEITLAAPIPAATELADRLRHSPDAETLLEYDLALYHIVADALEKSSIPAYRLVD